MDALRMLDNIQDNGGQLRMAGGSGIGLTLVGTRHIREELQRIATESSAASLMKQTYLGHVDAVTTLMHYMETHSLFRDALQLVNTIRNRAKAGAYSQEELVDIIFLFKKVSELADQLRKEANGINQQLQLLVCTRWVQMNINDPTGAEPIRGSLATGSPEVKLRVKVPKRYLEDGKTINPQFRKLMEWMKVPDEHIESNLLSVHWPRFQEIVQQLTEEGRQLPPGIVATESYDEYVVGTRTRRGTDIDDLSTILDPKKGAEPIEQTS